MEMVASLVELNGYKVGSLASPGAADVPNQSAHRDGVSLTSHMHLMGHSHYASSLGLLGANNQWVGSAGDRSPTILLPMAQRNEVCPSLLLGYMYRSRDHPGY